MSSSIDTLASERLHQDGLETWAILPYYSPTDTNEQSIVQLSATAEIATSIFDHTIVVADGKPMSKEELPVGVDHINLDTHLGKAAAIREGIYQVTSQSTDARDLVVQIATDFDQNPWDALRFLHRYTELRKRGHEPTLLIGDRYHHMPENLIRYRLGLLAMNTALSRENGYRKTSDFQSGFRAYTADLAETYADLGDSYMFGIEAEQTVLSMAQGARIEPVFLTRSRLRTASTAAIKWIENMNGMVDHSDKFSTKSGKYGKLTQVWEALDTVSDAMLERKDAKVIIPVAGVDREFFFYMSDDENYTLVHS